MLDTQGTAIAKVWSIECDLDTLKAIGDSVIEGLRAVREGGVEVGGLLLGAYDGDSLRIGSFEALPRRDSAGVAFSFSGEDEATLAERIRYHESRAARAGGPQVLGWYHSHARSGLGLRSEDLELLYRYFPEPWQVALVMRPSENGGAKAEFFFKEPAQPTLPPVPTDTTHAEPVIRRERRQAPIPPAPPGVGPRKSVERFTPAEIESSRRPIPWGAWAVMGCMAAASLAGFIVMRMHDSTPARQAGAQGAAPPVLPVEAISGNGGIEVHWDPKAAYQATKGELIVREGEEERRLPLPIATLQFGKMTYWSKSDVTRFRLVVERVDGTQQEGSTTYVAQGAPTALGGSETATEPPREKKTRRELARERRAEEQAERQRLARDSQTDGSRLIALSSAKAAGATASTKPVAVFIPPPQKGASAALDSPISAPPATIAQGGLHPAPGIGSAQIGVPPAAAPPPVPVPMREPQLPSLAGRWVLQPGATSRSPLPPQTVNISLADTNGWIQGTLEAQHRTGVPFKKEYISFSFGGKVVNGKARFPWTSGDGQRGQIEIIRVPNSPNSIEVVWYSDDTKRVFHETVRKSN